MRFACLIVTYTSAKQTLRLIQKLDNGDFDFYIHLDKKVNIETHRAMFDMPNVFFIKDRLNVKWAGFTVVEASFNGLKEIRESGREYASISLMSGQDYPIKSAAYISKFLAEHAHKQLIKHWDFETEWDEAYSRIYHYHFNDNIFKGKYAIQRLINSVIRRRKAPTTMRFYGTNSTFWTISPDCAYYVMDHIENDKKLKRFLKYTWGSDEFIFQTVIMNSPYKHNVINNNYRYVDWSGGGSHPKMLLTEDYEKIIASDNIFGRKFNIDLDEHILDMLDEHNRE